MKKDYGWTLKRPDGSLSIDYVRTTKREASDFFNEDFTEAMDCNSWAAARHKGYRIVRVKLVEV